MQPTSADQPSATGRKSTYRRRPHILTERKWHDLALTLLTDFVFVDEHNRHKRLKGMARLFPLPNPHLLLFLTMNSHEGVRRV
jgi:hypothetical protein